MKQEGPRNFHIRIIEKMRPNIVLMISSMLENLVAISLTSALIRLKTLPVEVDFVGFESLLFQIQSLKVRQKLFLVVWDLVDALLADEPPLNSLGGPYSLFFLVLSIAFLDMAFSYSIIVISPLLLSKKRLLYHQLTTVVCV